jgi:hypothetical protein
VSHYYIHALPKRTLLPAEFTTALQPITIFTGMEMRALRVAKMN